MLGNLNLGVYYPGDSLMHSLQARTKLLALIWIMFALTAANQRRWHFAPYVVAVALTVVAVGLARIPLGQLWRQMRLLLLSALVGAALSLFLVEGKPLYALGPLHFPDGSQLGPVVITEDGVWLLMSLFTLFLVLYALSLLLTMTTTPVGLIEGMKMLMAPLRRLRLPVDDFALMTLIALRFVPALMEETEQLIKAQTARGADFSMGSLGRRLRNLATLFIPLTEGSLRRAEELATALESRGYEAEANWTLLHEGSLRVADYLALGLVALAMAASLAV